MGKVKGRRANESLKTWLNNGKNETELNGTQQDKTEPVFTPIRLMWRRLLASRPTRVVHPAWMVLVAPTFYLANLSAALNRMADFFCLAPTLAHIFNKFFIVVE
tara:strand:+ start:25191 stop:25502 length:312 start_codon:yes stop_codon:yes gene_type:complete